MAALAMTIFGWGLAAEPHFVDESAYLSQSFYADLWLHQKWDDPLWLVYAGYDLPPLPKYVIGWSLQLQGHRRPPPAAMEAWYRDTSRRFVSPAALTAARWPSVLFGVMGCLAIYALGTLTVDWRVGLVASLGLMANPLYGLHARRAMSDVLAESLLLSALAVGLWSWKRLFAGEGRNWVSILGLGVGSGILGGLATLSKLNGSLALMILLAWGILAVTLVPRFDRGRMIVVATMLAGAVSFATFAAMNPFLFAHPGSPIDPGIEYVAQKGFWGRVKMISDHRVEVSARAKSLFPDDALTTLSGKIKVVLIQGFGRFGPFGPRGRSDSTIRFDGVQDFGALIWLPWVALGGLATLFRGRAQWKAGRPPTAWAIAVQAIVSLVVVTAFIPLAWDRYFLSIQPGTTLLAAIGAVLLLDRLRESIRIVPSESRA